jgi:hypothetical protein
MRVDAQVLLLHDSSAPTVVAGHSALLANDRVAVRFVDGEHLAAEVEPARHATDDTALHLRGRALRGGLRAGLSPLPSWALVLFSPQLAFLPP